MGPFSIRFYGIVYALGFLLVSHILSKKAEKKKIKNLDKDKAIDLVVYVMIAGLIGARIFHVLDSFGFYRDDLWRIFAIWEGGLGFIGGIIGGLSMIYFYCKKHKINLWQITDTIVVPIPLIVAFGRIANFINGEIVGKATNLPWCVVFQKVDNVCRHPAQLYHSLSQFVLFGIIFYLSKKRFSKKRGNLTLSYIIGYGIIRATIDSFRAQQAIYVRVLELSHIQIIGILMIISGIYWLIKNNQK